MERGRKGEIVKERAVENRTKWVIEQMISDHKKLINEEYKKSPNHILGYLAILNIRISGNLIFYF